MENIFTINTAKQAAEDNSLKRWVIDFLCAEGKNKHLAKHLTESEDLWVKLIEFPINKLRREMGPTEEGLTFSEDKKIWNKRIQSFVKDLNNGYKPCPLIATDFWEDIHLADGSHRHEALSQAGIDKYWTIFFLKNIENKKWITDNSESAVG
jgi:hypothetical protein